METCQRCEAEATVHLTERIKNGFRELHLCANCAKKVGINIDTPPAPFGLDAILTKLIEKNVGELVGEMATRTCPDCGLSFREFRVASRLGCPADYEVFAAGLRPLVKRAHGASRHVGKMPNRRQRSASKRLRLRARLREAVACEDYEAAAMLRDQLRQGETDS